MCTSGSACPFLHVADGAAADVRNEIKQSDSLSSSDDQNTDADMLWILERMDMCDDADASESRPTPAAAALDVRSASTFPALGGAASRVAVVQTLQQANPHDVTGFFSTSPSRVPSNAWKQQQQHGVGTGSSTRSAAATLATKILGNAFPSLTQREIADAYRDAGRDVLAAASIIRKTRGVDPVAGVLSLRAAPPPRAGGGAVGAPDSRARAAAATQIAASLERLSTGGSVASLYAAQREQAEALARTRNLAFDRATQAYISGDRKAAARFSRQGREADAGMRTAQLHAARAIFAARNSSSSSTSVGSALPLGGSATAFVDTDIRSSGLPSPAKVCVLDLHGLHPQEALDVVDAAARELSDGGPGGHGSCVWLAAITGARGHSKRLGKGGGSVHSRVCAGMWEQGWDVFADGSEDPTAAFTRIGVPGVAIIRIPAAVN